MSRLARFVVAQHRPPPPTLSPHTTLCRAMRERAALRRSREADFAASRSDAESSLMSRGTAASADEARRQLGPADEDRLLDGTATREFIAGLERLLGPAAL